MRGMDNHDLITTGQTAALLLKQWNRLGDLLPDRFITADGYRLELTGDGWVNLTGPSGAGLGRFTSFELALTGAVEHDVSRPYWDAVRAIEAAVVKIPGMSNLDAHRAAIEAADALVALGTVADRVRR
jgi:hypothetical protein